jgi:hypothetical protein
MKPINIEKFLSHSTGISDSYYRPTENDLLLYPDQTTRLHLNFYWYGSLIVIEVLAVMLFNNPKEMSMSRQTTITIGPLPKMVIWP